MIPQVAESLCVGWNAGNGPRLAVTLESRPLEGYLAWTNIITKYYSQRAGLSRFHSSDTLRSHLRWASVVLARLPVALSPAFQTAEQ